MDAAAEKPTEVGVRLAARECNERFPRPPWEDFSPEAAAPAHDVASGVAHAAAAPAAQAEWWAPMFAWFADLTKMQKAIFVAIGAAIFAVAIRR